MAYHYQYRENEMNAKDLLVEIQKGLEDLKALDVETFDLTDRSYISDYVVVATGTSTAHLTGISDRIYLTLKDDFKTLPLGVEGQEAGVWLLLDYNDVIVHLFVEDERAKYKIEEIFKGHPGSAGDAQS